MRWLPRSARRALQASARLARVAEERSQSAPSLCEACSATGQAARRARSFAPRINWGPPSAGIKSPPDASRPACGALHPQIDSWGANRSCPVVTFSPVKQVIINAGWYKKRPMGVGIPYEFAPRPPVRHRKPLIRNESRAWHKSCFSTKSRHDRVRRVRACQGMAVFARTMHTASRQHAAGVRQRAARRD